MNTVELINKYDLLLAQLGDDIKKSPYKTQFFLDLLDLKRGFFYKKIKEKRFTSEEVKLLSKYLYPEEHQDYELDIISKLIAKSRQEISRGKSKDFNLVLKESKEKYGL